MLLEEELLRRHGEGGAGVAVPPRSKRALVRRRREEPAREFMKGDREWGRCLGPHDAVDGLVRGGADGARRVALRRRLGPAVEALRLPLEVHRHLPEVARRAALDERHLRGEAHAVDVPARVEVVQAVQDHREAAEEGDVELWALDVPVVRHDGSPGPEGQHRLARHPRLRLPDVVLSEQELPVQVAHLDRVQVDLPPRQRRRQVERA